jgi:uncharacterized protein (TIGR00251 family)
MDEKIVWESDLGTFLKINVKPKSKRRIFLEFSESEIVANLQSPAREGKANVELLKKLAKFFGLSTSKLKIVVGHKAKTKTVFLEGISIDSVKSLLHSL